MARTLRSNSGNESATACDLVHIALNLLTDQDGEWRLTFSFDRNDLIPPQVEELPPCEKELAIVVYIYGPMTAKAIGTRLLTRKVSNSALRSVLGRLCRKQILRRHKINGSQSTANRRIPYVYSPAITPESLRIRAPVDVARDYFDGSLPRMAEELAGLCEARGQIAVSTTGGARIAA